MQRSLFTLDNDKWEQAKTIDIAIQMIFLYWMQGTLFLLENEQMRPSNKYWNRWAQ